MALRQQMKKLMIKFGLSGFFLILFFVGSLFILFNTPVRQQLREFFSPPERKILSVAVGHVTANGSSRVVKLLTPLGVQIEVYAVNDISTHEELIEVIPLDGTHDAHIQFQGQATNLALKDMNGDQIYEIIAPVYSKSLVPQLHMLTYNTMTKKFEIYKQ